MDIFLITIGLFGFIISLVLLIFWKSKRKTLQKLLLVFLACFVVGLALPDSNHQKALTEEKIAKEKEKKEAEEAKEKRIAEIDKSIEEKEKKESAEKENNTNEEVTKKEEIKKDTQVEKQIPKEYTIAIKKARIYSDNMHMSKKGIYNQLISEYGDQFPPEAAQYAVDNLNANYKLNAWNKAKIYQNQMSMSTKATYDQLISEHGEQFTKEEAQYAIDNLDK